MLASAGENNRPFLGVLPRCRWGDLVEIVKEKGSGMNKCQICNDYIEVEGDKAPPSVVAWCADCTWSYEEVSREDFQLGYTPFDDYCDWKAGFAGADHCNKLVGAQRYFWIQVA